jgi:hypothetical protein
MAVIRLGIRGKLRRTLESTNPCESMIDTVRTTQRNVKHWFDHLAELLLGFEHPGGGPPQPHLARDLDLPRLAVAIVRRLHLPQPNPTTTQEAAISVTL